MIGIESNQKALEQFFEEGNMKYRIEDKADLKVYVVSFKLLNKNNLMILFLIF